MTIPEELVNELNNWLKKKNFEQQVTCCFGDYSNYCILIFPERQLTPIYESMRCNHPARLEWTWCPCNHPAIGFEEAKARLEKFLKENLTT